MLKSFLWGIAIVGTLACSINRSMAQEDTQKPAKQVRIFALGNSFSISVFAYLPQVAKSAGYDLTLKDITIGGCSLETHLKNMNKEESDPEAKTLNKGTETYRSRLQSGKWDIVTIQQASHFSWDYKTYQPYAKDLCALIAKYAPGAEIVIQQTWAYRQDEKRLAKWGFGQEEMYERIFKAYNQAAEEMNMRIIPTGTAVQTARETQPVKYKPFKPEDYKYPDLPSLEGALVGNIGWSKDQKNLQGDAFHLNKRGRYLQACVWFAALIDPDTSKITFVPAGITEADAKFLRETAAKTVKEFKQFKK